MRRKALSGIMLALILLSMLALVSSVQQVKAETGFETENESTDLLQNQGVINNANPLEQVDCSSINKWDDFAYLNDDSAEMVIGLSNRQVDAYQKLTELVSMSDGQLTDSILMDGQVQAVVANVPSDELPSFMQQVEVAGLSTYVEPNIKFKLDLVPNDHDYLFQWAPPMIEAEKAWDTTTGTKSVLVAVVDTGIDWNHPDLAANYVSLGYDWVNKDADPMDDHGHGTHCAGIIAAVANNSIGIAGLAQVRIMAEKGVNKDGMGTEDDCASAIIHAVDQGANIISCSWGSPLKSELIYEAVRHAYDHGVLVVGSAGNTGDRLQHYPAAYDEVVAVTATTWYDDVVPFSSYGSWVEVAAPGVSIYSTVWDDSYAFMSGTSMAAPHAAGVAALIWSQFPSMTRDQVRAQLRFSADDLGLHGFDVYFGYGRINARKAVEQAPPEHDILILDLKTPSHLQPWNEAVINATVLNMGESDETDITVQFLVNGTVADTRIIDFLARGASTHASYLWKPVIEGSYNVTSLLVPAIGETKVNNNVLSKLIPVRFPKVLRVPQQFAKIQNAVDAAFEGDTIYVAPGRYYENVWINTENLTLTGESQGNTIIDGRRKTDVILVIVAKHVKISGITVLNSFTTNSGGVTVYLSEDVEIANVRAKDNAYAFFVLYSSNVVVSSNDVSGNYHGILLAYSANVTLRSNTMSGNKYGSFIVDGDSLNDFIHDVDASNIINGKPIIYWINIHNQDIPSNASYVALVNSTNITVRDLLVETVLLAYATNCTVKNVYASKNIYGIYLVYANSNTVTQSKFIDNDYGVALTSSNDNRIDGNTVVGSILRQGYPYGIVLYDSHNNIIIRNEVSGTAISFAGMFLSTSTDNLISRNKLAYNTLSIGSMKGIGAGIYLQIGSNNNIIIENTLLSNRYGISMGRLSLYGHDDENYDNQIYHNNFIGNMKQVFSLTSVNIWDDGFPSGGNYWSDCTDVDLCMGPNQDLLGSDRMWDHSYIIDANNRDRYPLVEPWTLNPLTRIFDLKSIIETWNLHKGTEKALTAKLNDAISLLNMGNETGAISKLRDLKNQVRAQKGEKLTNEQADYLTSRTQTIINLIEE